MASWSTILFFLSLSFFLQGNATPLQPREHFPLHFYPRSQATSTKSSTLFGTGTGTGSRVLSSLVSRTRNSTSSATGTLSSTSLRNGTSSSSFQTGTSSSSGSLTTGSHSTSSTWTISSVSGISSSSIANPTTRSTSQSDTSSSSSHTGTTRSESSSSLTRIVSNSSASSTTQSRGSGSSSATGPPGSDVLPFTTSSSTPTSSSSAPFTFSGSWSSSTAEPTTATWPFFLVPTTTVAPAEATHEAFFLADLFFALKANREWITDPKLKSQYIDNLDKVKNEVDALYNDLDVKPPPSPDCSDTKKRKRTVISEKKLRAVITDRSLLSAVADLAKEVAGLVTCATKIVDNLVDNVKLPDPPIDIIENLTDVLEAVGEDLKEDDPEDEKTSSQQTSTASKTSSSSSSCTGQTTFPVCTQTVSFSTSFYSGATSFTVATVTTTACKTSTVTGCATGSTTTTTASSTTSDAALCSPGCTACSWDGPTQLPTPPEDSQPQQKRDGQLGKRTIADPPTGINDINAFFKQTLEDTTYKSILVEHRHSGRSSARFSDFETTPSYMMVMGLFGCTSITVASEKGAWMSHHWESPGFGPGTTDATFKKNILDAIETQEMYQLFGKRPPQFEPATSMPALFPLLDAGQKLGPETNRQVFIMTPQALGNPDEYLYEDRVQLILDLLFGDGQPLAGITPTIRKYEKFVGTDEERNNLDDTSTGKMMLQYDNKQAAASGSTGQQAMYRLWMEDEHHDHSWAATDEQTGSCPLNQRKRDGSCTRPSSSAFEGGNGPTSTDTSGVTSTGMQSVSSSTGTVSTSSNSTQTSCVSSSRSGSQQSTSSGPTVTSNPASKSSSISPTIISTTTSLPPRVAAPDITVTTPSATPDCFQGYQTYTMPARATAPANAASLKFVIPEADLETSDWQFHLLPNLAGDPGNNVKSYAIGINSTGPPIKTGDGGSNLTISWQTPMLGNNTYIELFFNDDPAILNQTFGVVAYGSGIACMPHECSGPPKTYTNDDGMVCTLEPCSTDPSCDGGGKITPEAACIVVEDGAIIPLWYDVTIVTNNFISDQGASLKSNEKGCGDLLSWSVDTIDHPSADGSWVASQAFSFTLPLTIKGGCVERAIASAGGPSGLQCVNTESDWIF